MLLAAGWIAPGAAAQAGDRDDSADSVRIHEAARKAQAKFERTRQHRLPWSRDGGGGGCDEYVGRYCVRHDRGDDEWTPPREHREISEARDVLLAELRQAAERLPGDEWVIGQRVAYLLDAGRSDEALDAARACGAPLWWCEALRGLVHHERGETGAAERRFSAALASMPPDEHRRWVDAKPVLRSADARILDRAEAATRDSLVAVLWWLADPLWMRPGNDRLTEQHARHVRARIAARSRTPEGVRWAADMEELLLRFGWPAGWERRSSGGLERRVSIVTHHPGFGRGFVPPLSHAAEPWHIPADGWELAPRIPLEEYAAPHARFDGAMEHQFVVLPDGDSVTLAAAFAFRHDSVVPAATMLAALVAATPEESVMDSAAAPAHRIVRAVRVPKRNMVVSLESVVDGEPPRAARARFGVLLAQRDTAALELSDPLLVDAAAAPASQGAAIARLLLPSEAERADSIGVYFEAHRLAPDVPVEIELTLEPERGGTLRRIGESVGLVSPRSAVRLAWEEPPPSDGRLTRGVVLGFREVPDGRYVLYLLVRQGSAWAASRARIER